MKIFISQPMRGKTAEEIITERERLIGKAREHYGADIEVIDSYIQHGVKITAADEHGGCARARTGLGVVQRMHGRESGRYPVRP